MENKSLKFLFDENIPIKLKQIFNDNDFSVDTVQKLGWSGMKNGELSKRSVEGNYVLVTRDKDFIYLWEKYDLQVVYLAIHPPIMGKLSPRVTDVIVNWENKVSPFLILVQDDSVRIWMK